MRLTLRIFRGSGGSRNESAPLCRDNLVFSGLQDEVPAPLGILVDEGLASSQFQETTILRDVKDRRPTGKN